MRKSNLRSFLGVMFMFRADLRLYIVLIGTDLCRKHLHA
jgi:hypothetical protein